MPSVPPNILVIGLDGNPYTGDIDDLPLPVRLNIYGVIDESECQAKIGAAEKAARFRALNLQNIPEPERVLIEKYTSNAYLILRQERENLESRRSEGFKELPPICLYVSDDTIFDAFPSFSTESDDTIAIVMTHGVFRLIRDTINRVIMTGEILNRLGISDGMPDVNCIRPVPEDAADLPPVPEQLQSPLRQCVADFMVVQALRFLLLHEYVHVRNGHYGYLDSVFPGFFRMSERRLNAVSMDAGSGYEGEVSFMDRQAMEADADWVGMSFLLGRTIHLVDYTISNASATPEMRVTHGTDRNALVLTICSVMIVFRMFASHPDYDRPSDMLHVGDYPTHLFRMYSAARLMVEWLDQKLPPQRRSAGVEQFAKDSLLQFLYVERAFRRITGDSIDEVARVGERWVQLIQQDYAHHTDQLNAAWRTLR